MRVCPTSIREAVQRYDADLDIRWVESDPATGELVTRWEIRRKGKDGQMHHITFWQQVVMFNGMPHSAFKELNENEVLEWLHRRDSRRFGSLKDFMHSLGMKYDEQDDFKEAGDMLEEKRYSESIRELAEKIDWLRHKYPEQFDCGANDAEEDRRYQKKLENAAIVADAQDRRVGKVALDKDGIAVRVE